MKRKQRSETMERLPPISDKQCEFIRESNRRWNVKTGATRSGKSYLDVLYTIPKRILERRGEDGLVVLLGNTKGTLQRNVLDPMTEIYGSRRVSAIRSDNTATLFGERVYCLGADNKKHVDRLRGSSIKYCYGDEVTTWSREVFEMLKSRLDKPCSRFDGTCNPDSPGHWFKAFLDSGADIYTQTYTIDDNPYLPPEFVRQLKLEYAGTVYYDRYILGRWALAEGLVYPMFGESCITDELPDKGEYYISCDYGTLNPFSAGLWRWDGRRATRIREYYYSGREAQRSKTDEEYYAELERLAGGLRIRSVIVDPSAASFIEVIRRHRRFSVRRAKNDVLPGIMTVARYLQNGTIRIGRECGDAIREFGLYRWDERCGEDRPVKENDHCMDEIRYFAYTILREKAGRDEYTPLWNRQEMRDHKDVSGPA